MDVMLVLLVIFMATAPTFLPQVINLPSVSKANQVATTPIQLIIQNDKTYLVKIENMKDKKFQTLNELIAEVRKSYDPSRAIVIEADKGIIYDEVVQVMDYLKRANIAQIGLLVKSK